VNSSGNYNVSGVAVVVTNDGGMTWGPSQLVYDQPNCSDGQCEDYISFFAQMDSVYQSASPQLYISYWTPNINDTHTPFSINDIQGWHLVRWVPTGSIPMNQFVPKDDISNFPQPTFVNQVAPQQLRFAVGRCGAASPPGMGSCTAGDSTTAVVVALASNTGGFGEYCPGTTRNTSWFAAAWHEGDAAWTPLTPTAFANEPARPDCLDGIYSNNQETGITFDPLTPLGRCSFSRAASSCLIMKLNALQLR